MTRDTGYQRAKRRLHQKLRPSFDAIRIPWFLGWSLAGIWFATSYLAQYPWHHAMITWIVPAGVAALSLIRLCQALVAWLTVRAWLREGEVEARARVEVIQPYTHIVPPWTRTAYLERRRALMGRGARET